MNVPQHHPQAAFPYYQPSSMAPDRQPSPQLSSNNPFRNRALSPATTGSPSPRPEQSLPTNPFFNNPSNAFPVQSVPQTQAPAMPPAMPPTYPPTIPPTYPPAMPPAMPPSTVRPEVDHTSELFANLSVNPPQPQPNAYRPAQPPRFQSLSNASQRRERPDLREETLIDVFADPPNPNERRPSEKRRPRRNSESSIMDQTPKLVDTEDEIRKRERRRRERDARRRDGKHQHSSKRPPYQLDIIDKLDVTSIYGTGMFHHDGPFDACNPNRNRRGLRTAPMQAFPKDSANMALGGAGPLNNKLNLDLFNGTTSEAHTDFAASGIPSSKNQEIVDTRKRFDPVHGAESMGLGTSTFLDGAPASRAAMQQRKSENDNGFQPGGLFRSKSLAQRFRKNNNNGPSAPPIPPPKASPALSHNDTVKSNDGSRFNHDYDDAWEKQGARIHTAGELQPDEEIGRSRSASGPHPVGSPDRKHTIDRSLSGLDNGKANTGGGGGFLNRMKSIRKPKPDRRMSED